MSRQRGMALITVLWIIMILSLVSFTLASAVRGEMVSANDSFDSERAFFMAKGAAETVYYGMVHKTEIAGDDSPIVKENGEYLFPFEYGDVRVRLDTGAGRIDLNGASDVLLASLFDSVGVNQETKNRLVDSILDWRDADDIPHLYGAEVDDYPENRGITDRRLTVPRNGPFATVDELLKVKNMTPEIFYGSFFVDPVTRTYRRVVGISELVTVSSGSSRVDVNEAPLEVLMALPQMDLAVSNEIIELRAKKRFSSSEDLLSRVLGMNGRAAMDFFEYGSVAPTTIVARATIRRSGATRTVRLLFTRTQRLHFLSLTPLIYQRIEDLQFGRWQYQ